MSKYFIDTEFLEGTQKESFPISLFRKHTPNTIDLISIGIVEEDQPTFSNRIGKTDRTIKGREYYAISKDFNLKEAWNRYDEKVEIMSGDMRNQFPNGRKYKEYWIRENVLKPIFIELLDKYTEEYKKALRLGICIGAILNEEFSYKLLKFLINRYGKTNKQIAEEIEDFTTVAHFEENPKGRCLVGSDFFIDSEENTKPVRGDFKWSKPKFYAYFADYDWVCLSWLFGKMIDLPNGFPKFSFDIQQLIIDNNIDKNQLKNEVPQINSHNALHDAIWNKKAYEWIQKKLNNA